MTDHLARIAWTPALQAHQIVCTTCGEVLVADIETLGLFLWDGECEPGENLSVSVDERIQITDVFGMGD